LQPAYSYFSEPKSLQPLKADTHLPNRESLSQEKFKVCFSNKMILDNTKLHKIQIQGELH
jgi:hypothetical protein